MRYIARNAHHHGNVSIDFAGRVDRCSSSYFFVPNPGPFADEEAPVMTARTDHLKAALRLELGLKGPPPS